MKKILIIVDYQNSFKNSESSKTVAKINALATKHEWDSIIQTMWFNSQEEESLYMKNLDYSECTPYDRSSGLVKKFKDASVVTRYDKYSCLDENLARRLHGDCMTYVAGWETDACVLGTCFDLFDRGILFKVVTDCIASKNADIHNSAIDIMRRNFGDVIFVESGGIE